MENKVADFRKRLNMTQEELADRLDVSRQTIGSIEKGRYNPSLALAFRLARLFECSVETLFIYKGE